MHEEETHFQLWELWASLGTNSRAAGSFCPGSAPAGRSSPDPLQQLLSSSVQVWMLCVGLLLHVMTGFDP